MAYLFLFCENRRQLPSAGISSAFFFAYASLTSLANWKTKKTASRNKMLIKFYIPQWTVDNVRTNNMVTPFQKKRATCIFFSTDEYKKARQMRFSTAGYVWSTQNRVVSNPAVLRSNTKHTLSFYLTSYLLRGSVRIQPTRPKTI